MFKIFEKYPAISDQQVKMTIMSQLTLCLYQKDQNQRYNTRAMFMSCM